jgi:erythromycin esterase-like protein
MTDWRFQPLHAEKTGAFNEFFYAEQNARLVANAERYYRSMFHGRDESWNLRDEHMTDTLSVLIGHFDSGRSKVVVWAHNSHLGDARATEMSERGEWNVGQLTRERFASKVFGIGFSSYSGSVTAARDRSYLPARDGTLEPLL